MNDYKDKLKEIKEESNFETLKLQEIETLNQEKKESISKYEILNFYSFIIILYILDYYHIILILLSLNYLIINSFNYEAWLKKARK